MTIPIAPGVAVPDKVETSIGTLNLSYGYPDNKFLSPGVADHAYQSALGIIRELLSYIPIGPYP